jgi:glycosyltransferase involved in cell wall biosynthesis
MEGFRSTVVIPVFNTGEVLRETLECVLSLSGEKDEVVIVDDCSTDAKTLDVIKGFRRRPNVKVVRHDRNRGLGAARNTGVKNASADIIIPLDSDDLLAPEYCEKMLEPFKDPEVAFTYCNVQCFGDSEELWPTVPFDEARIVKTQYICGCSPFRRSVHEAVGGYSEEEVFRDMNEDWDFWLGVIERGYKGVYVPGGMYLYRRHELNMTTVPRIFSAVVQRRMLERHWGFITKYVSPEQFMAHGYEEAGYAHLKTGEPKTSAWYAGKLLKIPRKRLKGVRLLISTARHILNKGI